MALKNLFIAGEQYTDIDQLSIPESNDQGTAASDEKVTFFEISDATATKNDVADDKIAYGVKADGVYGLIQGQLKKFSDGDNSQFVAYELDSNNYTYKVGFGFKSDNNDRRYIRAFKSTDPIAENENVVWLETVDSRYIQKDQTIAGVKGQGWKITHTEGSSVLTIE